MGASLLTPLLFCLLALRWKVLLRKQGLQLRYLDVLAFTWTGQFFNSILPGSTGGDVSKIVQACAAAPEHKSDAAVSVVMDRLTALVSIVAIGAAAFVVGPSRGMVFEQLTRFGGGGWVLLTCLGTGIVLLFAAAWTWRHAAVREAVARILCSLRVGFRPDARMLGALALAVIGHFLVFSLFYLFARALGVGITYLQVLQIVPIVLIVTLVPVTVNGHGLREALLVVYFSQMGIEMLGERVFGTSEIVLSLTAVLIANEMLWSLPGGLLLLRRSLSGPSSRPGCE